MNYLAIDASTEACSVALQYNDEIFTRYEICPQSHSIRLLPMIDEVLTDAGCKLTQLDGLIFGRGPGSFTGVRIAVGVAQGLSFSADLPVIGVSTLQAMAQQAYKTMNQSQVIAAIDARMSEVYCCYFELNVVTGLMEEKLAEKVIAPSLLEEHLAPFTAKAFAVGSGWDAYPEELNTLRSNTAIQNDADNHTDKNTDNNSSIDILFPTAEAMLVIGQAAFERGDGVSAEQAQPVYVRDTVSWKKLPGRE